MDLSSILKNQSIESGARSSSSSISLDSKSNLKNTSPNGFSTELKKSLDNKSLDSKNSQPKDKITLQSNTKNNENKEVQTSNTKTNENSNQSETAQVQSQKVYTRKTPNEQKSQNVDFSQASEKNSSKNEVSEDLMALFANLGVQPSLTPAASEPELTKEEVSANFDQKVLNPKIEGLVSQDTKPILKFLKEMAETLKISPQEVMGAFSQLSPESLMQEPRAAMTQLFEKLQIQPKQFTKAQILFNQMLSEMEQVELSKSEQVFKNPALSSQFQFSKSQINGKVDTLAEVKNSAHQLEFQTGSSFFTKNSPAETTIDLNNLKIPEPKLNVQVSELNQVLPQANLNMKPMDFDSFVNQMALLQNNPEIKNIETSQQQLGADLSESFDLQSEDINSDNMEVSDEALFSQLLDGNKNTNLQKVLENIVQANKPEVQAENVELLNKNTQLLIQKGGGEMKIQLTPEGMGEVLLKVKVQDGQVGVQLTTDNVQAKKLIENNILELRSQLADQKLNLETIKVDVADKMQDQFQNFNSDLRREEAREFLGQFRQHNDSFRQAVLGNQSNRAYKSSAVNSTPDLQPLNKNKSSNGRLHLVA